MQSSLEQVFVELAAVAGDADSDPPRGGRQLQASTDSGAPAGGGGHSVGEQRCEVTLAAAPAQPCRVYAPHGHLHAPQQRRQHVLVGDFRRKALNGAPQELRRRAGLLPAVCRGWCCMSEMAIS